MKSVNTYGKQGGSALVMVLVFMVIFALVGLSSLEMSSRQMQISTNFQLDKLAFQGAESGSEAVLRKLQLDQQANIAMRSANSVLTQVLSGRPQMICIDEQAVGGIAAELRSADAEDVQVGNLCQRGLNEFAIVRSYSILREPNPGEANIVPPGGYDIENGLGFVGVVGESVGQVGGVEDRHIQVWGVLAPQL